MGHPINVHPRGGMYVTASPVCEYNSMSIDVHQYTMYAYLLGNDEQLHKLHNSLGITIRMPILLLKSAPQHQATLEHSCSLCAWLSCVCIMSTAHGHYPQTQSRYTEKMLFHHREWFKSLLIHINSFKHAMVTMAIRYLDPWFMELYIQLELLLS